MAATIIMIRMVAFLKFKQLLIRIKLRFSNSNCSIARITKRISSIIMVVELAISSCQLRARGLQVISGQILNFLSTVVNRMMKMSNIKAEMEAMLRKKPN